MKCFFSLLVALVFLAFSVQAAELPASNCQLFIKELSAQPNSHGAASIAVKLKVSWLGNGETIQQIGYRAHRLANDLGNTVGFCGSYPADSGWLDYAATQGPYADSQTQHGESLFSFNVRTGSIASTCPGYTFDTQGAFFVRTNLNTYWLNPDLDSNRNFDFDENAYDILQHKFANYAWRSTLSEDMRYYNPRGCR